MHIYGHCDGTLDDNGQVWYDYDCGQSDLRSRRHATTITDTINSFVEGLRFINTQMWTMTVTCCERMLPQDIWVDCTAVDLPWRGNINTDGVDTIYANTITFSSPGRLTTATIALGRRRIRQTLTLSIVLSKLRRCRSRLYRSVSRLN